MSVLNEPPLDDFSDLVVEAGAKQKPTDLNRSDTNNNWRCGLRSDTMTNAVVCAIMNEKERGGGILSSVKKKMTSSFQ